jgi:uncharacterized protein (TIGR03437 family)
MTSKFATVRTALLAGLLVLTSGAQSQAATFGRVVPLGGNAADLALDEARGLLYVANYTANRIEVLAMADGASRSSINVGVQPASLAMTPNGKYLVIGHYANFAPPNNQSNLLTVLDLTNQTRRTFVMPNPVLGVGIGYDGLALVVTTKEFISFEPAGGTWLIMSVIADFAATELPVPLGINFPPNITKLSMNISNLGNVIYGLTDTFTFRWDLGTRRLTVLGYTSTPKMGPRAVSVNRDGTGFVGGWVLRDSVGHNLAQFPEANGALEVGSHGFDSKRGLIYSEVPVAGGLANSQPPMLQIVDYDNLRVREKVRLAEHLAGKAVMTSDYDSMYAISDSGITILPVRNLNVTPRVAASRPDLVFQGTFCDRRVLTQDVTILTPGGGTGTDFALSVSAPGVTLSTLSGVTPATVRVSVDMNMFQAAKGTQTITINITSTTAVNIPDPIRVLINNKEPDQRGTIVNLPGNLVDVIGDPIRDRFYILRQDTNEVVVFAGNNYTQLTTLRTGNTPTQMAITFDNQYLLVGHENSQLLTVINLNTLTTQAPVFTPGGHYPRSVATSGGAILTANRVAGPVHTIDRVDLASRTASTLPTLGVWENDIDISTYLASSPNGGSILAASAKGQILLYSANADTFTISRDTKLLLSGPVAASAIDQYVIGNTLYNSSLVGIRSLDDGSGLPSGFAFLDQLALRTTSASATSPGVIQRLDPTATLANGPSTRMVEAPVTGAGEFVFTRTLAPLGNRALVINLTNSGFTVLPWNFDAAVAPPVLNAVVNAADGTPGLAPGGLISIFGSNMSPINQASSQLPLPTALGESCITINGAIVPLMYVSSTQINAQVPFTIIGNATMTLRTPGGVSNNLSLLVKAASPGVFRVASPTGGQVAVIWRVENNQLVTLANPVHRGDFLTILLTGMGSVTPGVEAGSAAPSNPLAFTQIQPLVRLGGTELPVQFSGLAPGMAGVNQINVEVPWWTPLGVSQTLEISQGGVTTSFSVRVVQ